MINWTLSLMMRLLHLEFNVSYLSLTIIRPVTSKHTTEYFTLPITVDCNILRNCHGDVEEIKNIETLFKTTDH